MNGVEHNFIAVVKASLYGVNTATLIKGITACIVSHPLVLSAGLWILYFIFN